MELEVRSDMDKVDDVMPGFRFHPTDEELVGYYLKRKVQQKSLPIDLIKQVDIYKYDPWDLPKLASTGEKEWYFYCPRDRKYRNSARPNRVTRAGFWKATGTDRPIYSSEGKCIGLKKSLVFYRGRAAKGMKTDWMMHEFRLPCMSSDSAAPPKKLSDKSFSATDSWAICRIFKKTNSLSMVQKALSHPWISELPGSMVSDLLTQGAIANSNHQFCSENITSNQFCGNNKQEFTHQVSNANNTNFSSVSASEIPPYKPIINSSSTITVSKSLQIPVNSDGDLADNLMFYTLEPTGSTNPDFIGFEEPTQLQNYGGFSISLPQDMQLQPNIAPVQQLNQFEFPFNFPSNDAWKNALASWDSSLPSPTEMSTSFSINKCYT